MTENERFELVFAKTGSINSGTGQFYAAEHTLDAYEQLAKARLTASYGKTKWQPQQVNTLLDMPPLGDRGSDTVHIFVLLTYVIPVIRFENREKARKMGANWFDIFFALLPFPNIKFQ
jgi:hypothetical protein